MYCLSEEQIEYILNDIRRNGVEMEDLQLNLLDHICCILEHDLKENDDFESFYHKTIKQFYKRELCEIEEETINLLTFKNYYAMKKLMILSGAYAAIAFIIGAFFKIMFWEGTSFFLITAILVFSLVFLPLMFLLKTKEAGSQRDKLILSIGTVVGILYCLSMLWQIQRWPGTHAIWLTTLAISFFVFLPVYFFSGIRKPETKANTIVSAVLLMGFLGIQFTMTALRPSPQVKGKVYAYIQSQQLLERMQHTANPNNKMAQDIQNTCEEMKALILKDEIGVASIPGNFESQNITIRERNRKELFSIGRIKELLEELRSQVGTYNASVSNDPDSKIPLGNSILDDNFASREFCSDLYVLNNITQIQLFLINAQNKFVATK